MGRMWAREDQKNARGIGSGEDLFFFFRELASQLIMHPLLYIIKCKTNIINIILKVIIWRYHPICSMVNERPNIPNNCSCRNIHRNRVARIQISEIFVSNLFTCSILKFDGEAVKRKRTSVVGNSYARRFGRLSRSRRLILLLAGREAKRSCHQSKDAQNT